ncbi:MAG: YcaO-related McrA-glycine thioamidation protein [Candidatus Methanoplasma sp.]|jgi:ribosomal protein S12 methylthiotransferase accessory factor|nr:YcaO-related McrA-glycine thioamidation protein [Candidatus Methanoplasma sp.]
MILNRCPKCSPETGIRVIPPEETIKNVLPALSKAEMMDPEDITGTDNIGIPVFSIGRPSAPAGKYYNGKGPTREQALASALMEAMERYSAELRDTDEIVYGTYGEACETGYTIDPAAMILPPDILGQYRSAEIAWTRAYELFRGKPVWVPACAVYYPYIADTDIQLFKYHTNGIAAGNTIEEAVLHSLFELIERDAWSIAEDRNIANADVIVEEGSVPWRLLNMFEKEGVKINLKDLTNDIGIPTIGAASDDTATRDPEMLSIGVGTHLDPEIACIRAITEVAQSRTTHKHGMKINAKLQKAAIDMGYDKIKELNGVWYRDLEKKVHLKDMPNLATDYVLDDIEVVLGKLMESGFQDVVIADLTRSDVNIPAVRAIVPGLEVSTMDPDRVGMRIRGSR